MYTKTAVVLATNGATGATRATGATGPTTATTKTTRWSTTAGVIVSIAYVTFSWTIAARFSVCGSVENFGRALPSGWCAS